MVLVLAVVAMVVLNNNDDNINNFLNTYHRSSA